MLKDSLQPWKMKFIDTLDLSNYGIKADLKNAASIDTSAFAKKTDLANLKSDVDELNIYKFKNVPSGWRQFKK